MCTSCHHPNGMGVPDVNPTAKWESRSLAIKHKLIDIVIKGSATHAEDQRHRI